MNTRIHYSKALLMFAPVLLMITGVGMVKGFGQGQYRTSTGTIVITLFLEERPVKITSDDLLIMLDYETGKLVMKLPVSALATDNDTLANRFRNKKGEFIRFEGKLGLDYINTQGHPPLDFKIEGIVLPQNYHVIGSGYLVHIVHGHSRSCLLSMNFRLKTREFFPGHQLPGLSEDVYVEVVQSLLGRVNKR